MARPHPLLFPLAARRALPAPPTLDDGLLASAIDHGMQGLLWTYVREHAPDYEERTRLAGIDVASRQRHARLRRTLVGVRQTLAEIDVEVAAVKGVTAEARWYGREGERPCADVDVLVDPSALARAGDVVHALDPTHRLVGEIDWLVRRGVMQSVNLDVDAVSVDLHFDLLKLGYPMRQRDEVWSRMKLYTLADEGSVRVPDAATSLVHFLVHANKDAFPRLLGYADVVRVLGSDDGDAVDWDWFARLVHDEGLDVIVACALDTISRALALPTAAVPVARGWRAPTWHVVWPERVTLLGSSGTDRSRRQEALPFLVTGRLGDALRSSARVVFPPPSTVAAQYPDLTGSYGWRLLRGRTRTWRARRASFTARQAPGFAPPATGSRPPTDVSTAERDPQVTARVLRARAGDAPLWLPVWGRSMGQSIPSGVQVRVEPAPQPRRGDVWAFCNDRGQIVIHRCRGDRNGAYRFQGDVCVRPDPPVAPGRLIGRVVETAPPRRPIQWGPAAGAARRAPRVAVARAVRIVRGVRARNRR